MQFQRSILISLLSIGNILLGYSYVHEWYGVLESEVQYWGYFSEVLGLLLLILAWMPHKGNFTRVILSICLVIQIPPIILWFIFHGGEITDYVPAFSDQFVAHWAFSVPHILLAAMCVYLLKLIKRNSASRLQFLLTFLLTGLVLYLLAYLLQFVSIFLN
ncbi:MAG: hypothetical protein PHC39_05755 [Proteiniphilum sp.]|nr:hypothetical protein [Proteiniphilum sp.]MDD3908628.1 hypothetical protein [Proteiniphilum sp.]